MMKYTEETQYFLKACLNSWG